MMFPNNQVGQLYVVNKVAEEKVKKTDSEGTIRMVEGTNTQGKKYVYYEYRGADSDRPLMRSDLIYKDNLISQSLTQATKMAEDVKVTTLTLDASINEGKPIAGQDYVVNIFIRQYIGISDEDIHLKHGVVHAVKDMSAAQFYQKLAASLWMNFSREVAPLLSFTLGEKVVAGVKTVDGIKLPMDAEGKVIEGTDTGIIITPVEQEWQLGVKEQVPVYYDVNTATVSYGDGDVNWSKVTTSYNKGAIKNGRKIADMEYYYMGERGDQYRSMGWPLVIPTKYLVDASKEYNVINIHYAYVGPNEGVQKSEKDLIIVAPTDVTITGLLPS